MFKALYKETSVQFVVMMSAPCNDLAATFWEQVVPFPPRHLTDGLISSILIFIFLIN